MKVKLYHGTDYKSAMNICLNGIDLSKSKPNLDFGSGFYTTSDYSKARKRALLKAKYEYNNAYVVTVDVDDECFSTLNVKKFEDTDIEWGIFILHNRLGIEYVKKHGIYNHNLDNKYDIVIGDIADGIVSSVAHNVRRGNMSIKDVDFDDFLTIDKESYGDQISFHSQRALDYILSIKCDKIRNRGW